MACYRSGGCGPYEMYSCSECPASKPEYAQRQSTGSQKEVRLIDANKLPVVTEWCVDEAGFGASFKVVHEEDINKAPTIDPESLRPQGEWEDAEDGDGLVCPSCGVDFCVLANETERFNYCPNCGAKMKGGAT